LSFDAPVSELIEALEIVHSGTPYFGPSVARLIVEDYVRRMTTKVSLKVIDLTAKEQEIANRLSRGEQTKTIANDLEVSIRTVEKHRENITRKSLPGDDLL
jgi:DNA-binding NarL/FixJ family response regulator